ncbi:MAG: hypothetical protein HFH72_04370 [Lachnospiraceae bacterium]|nr:hypothetical protein [Lachnospiraceae bacterium]
MMKRKTGFISFLAAAGAGIALTVRMKNEEIQKRQKSKDKFKGYYNLLNQWLRLRQENKSLGTFFTENQYKTAAIYGMGELGNRLYDELKDSAVQVKYAIDENTAGTYSEIEVIGPEGDFPEVDVIVVTAVFAYREIEEKLSGRTDIPIVSLEDIVYEI